MSNDNDDNNDDDDGDDGDRSADVSDEGGIAQFRTFAQDVDALNTNLASLLTLIEIITSVVTLMETDAGLRVDRWDVDYVKIIFLIL